VSAFVFDLGETGRAHETWPGAVAIESLNELPEAVVG
jgi:hypothetical protein